MPARTAVLGIRPFVLDVLRRMRRVALEGEVCRVLDPLEQPRGEAEQQDAQHQRSQHAHARIVRGWSGSAQPHPRALRALTFSTLAV